MLALGEKGDSWRRVSSSDSSVATEMRFVPVICQSPVEKHLLIKLHDKKIRFGALKIDDEDIPWRHLESYLLLNGSVLGKVTVCTVAAIR